MTFGENHLFDKVTRFGYTAHGLAYGTQGDNGLLVDGVSFPLPFAWPFNAGDITQPYDTHLLKVPGVAELTLSPEEVAAEKAAGRTWQNYALLSEDRLVLFGKILNGWVCIDGAGARWLITCDPAINMRTFNGAQPLSLQLSAVRFGHFGDGPATPTVQTVTLASVGQSSSFQAPPSGGAANILQLRIGSVSSDGRNAVIEIHGVQSLSLPATLRQNTAPSGFLLLELTGNGPAFGATLSVLRTREQVLGTFTEQRATAMRCKFDITWSSTSSPRAGGADVVATPNGSSSTPVAADSIPATSPFMGSAWVGGQRTGRIAAIIFDDANNLMEFTYDTVLRADYSYPAFNTVSATGTVEGWIADNSDYASTSVTSTAVVSVERTSTELITGSITVKRNGVTVAGGEFKVERTIAESRTVNAPAQLRRVGGQVIGGEAPSVWATEAAYSHTSLCTTDTGVGAKTWNLMPISNLGSYTLGLWASFTTTPGTKPYGYGATVTFGSTTTDDYAGSTLTLRRFSNNVFGVLVTARAGLKPTENRVPSLAAPQAVWSNTGSADANSSRLATYHPYTHEIFTALQDGALETPFVWI